MSPRPRTAPDSCILDAAARLLARFGPARMRLEDVAREVGLAPATLLLRFKSKRNLLLSVADHCTAGMAEQFRERRRRNPSALHTVTEVCELVRELAEEPQQLANLLAFLQLSFEDPAFRERAQRHDVALATAITELLDEAQARGEMRRTDSVPLAHAVIAMVRGSLLTWSALGRETAPDAWVRGDLETLLGSFRISRPDRAAPTAHVDVKRRRSAVLPAVENLAAHAPAAVTAARARRRTAVAS
ncbi:MAG: helix-turn-helix transcriptional regulator [Acidobacteria bacterium]|nr:helix-turn-helix transcriptional regulator [Acidobacteriota bacterium]